MHLRFSTITTTPFRHRVNPFVDISLIVSNLFWPVRQFSSQKTKKETNHPTDELITVITTFFTLPTCILHPFGSRRISVSRRPSSVSFVSLLSGIYINHCLNGPEFVVILFSPLDIITLLFSWFSRCFSIKVFGNCRPDSSLLITSSAWLLVLTTLILPFISSSSALFYLSDYKFLCFFILHQGLHHPTDPAPLHTHLSLFTGQIRHLSLRLTFLCDHRHCRSWHL